MKRRAFSLIELLVVVGIIAILIAMLLPALVRVRETAVNLQCMTQLRQVGVAIFAYAASNAGNTPCWSLKHEWPDDPFPPDPAPGWPVLLARYIGQNPDGRVWNCPAFPNQNKYVSYFIGARWMSVQVVNPPDENGYRGLRSLHLGSIRMSTSYIMVGECSNQRYYPDFFGSDAGGEREDIDKDDAIMRCLTFFGEAGGYNMHRAGNNVLFSDGHVATFKKWDPSALTYSPRSPAVEWGQVTQE